MNIRTKLTVMFFGIVIVVLTIISVSIYYFSSEYRKEDFYRRLTNRAINTVKVLVEVEEVNAELLRRIESNNPASLPNQYIVIYNYKNEVVYSSQSTSIIPFDTTVIDRIRLLKELKFKHANYEAVGFLFTDKYDRFTVIAAATDVYGLYALKNLRNVLITTFCVSLVFVSILGWIYAGKALSPIAKIVTDVSNITAANLDQRLREGNNKDELSKLAATFNKMLERLANAFKGQKHFIANASHEIKTPITIMASEIEVTLLQDRSTEYYKDALKSVLGGLKGLNRLSTQLLLLAQTTSDVPRKNFSPFRVDDALWEMKEEFLKVYPLYHVDILFSLDVNHEFLEINGDEQLIKVAIMNLIENGCKYSGDNKVLVNLTSHKDRHIVIDFINHGEGIQEDLIDKIFDPFYRGQNHKSVKGFGIGLSLVSTIVKVHGGDIHVESIQHQHTRFSLRLPVKH